MPPPGRICSVIDCGRTHYARGFCRMHYLRWKRRRKSRDAVRAMYLALRVAYPSNLAVAS